MIISTFKTVTLYLNREAMRRVLKFLLKIIVTFFKYLLYLILFFAIMPYTLVPVYDFPEPKPFSGDKLYNPYAEIDKDLWKKGNFQLQSKAWGGITDGSVNEMDQVLELYNYLEYDIIAISDYQKINRYDEKNPAYIPTYEHGYNTYKTHQVCIGAERVCWLDYPLYHTIHTKQFMFDVLKKQNQIVVAAHPDFGNAYYVDDMKYLTNYDILEALNQQKYSFGHWDAALSSGHPVFIMGNDDSHNINNPTVSGAVCTMINLDTITVEKTAEALRSGLAYGFVPYTPNGETFEKKKSRLPDLTYLHKVDIIDDTIKIELNKNADSVKFVGQDGEIKSYLINPDKIEYVFQDDDTYIRAEIFSKNLDRVYLNPIFRYSGDHYSKPDARINITKTIIYRGGAIIFLILLVIFVKRYLNVRKASRKIT
jgi:hypothetical protein